VVQGARRAAEKCKGLGEGMGEGWEKLGRAAQHDILRQMMDRVSYDGRKYPHFVDTRTLDIAMCRNIRPLFNPSMPDWCRQHYLGVFRIRQPDRRQPQRRRLLKKCEQPPSGKPDPVRILRALRTGIVSLKYQDQHEDP
jgi:hypothetical protein